MIFASKENNRFSSQEIKSYKQFNFWGVQLHTDPPNQKFLNGFKILSDFCDIIKRELIIWQIN